MKVLIHTYKTISWLVKPYIHLHDKYWGEDALLVAEEDYSDGRFEFMRPTQVETENKGDHEEGVIHAGSYVQVMAETLNAVEDKYVLIMMADYLLKGPVNKELIATLESYMDEKGDVLRCQIGDGPGTISHSTHTDTYKDIKIFENNFLPSSLTPALWDKEKLKTILGGCTAWDMEIQGRDKFPGCGWRSIWPDPTPMPYLNALRGRHNDAMVITPEVLAEIKHMIPSNIKVD